MKLKYIYFSIYTKYIYVSNVLINLLLFELSNYRKVQFTKWNSCKNPLIDRLMWSKHPKNVKNHKPKSLHE